MVDPLKWCMPRPVPHSLSHSCRVTLSQSLWGLKCNVTPGAYTDCPVLSKPCRDICRGGGYYAWLMHGSNKPTTNGRTTNGMLKITTGSRSVSVSTELLHFIQPHKHCQVTCKLQASTLHIDGVSDHRLLCRPRGDICLSTRSYIRHTGPQGANARHRPYSLHQPLGWSDQRERRLLCSHQVRRLSNFEC